MGEDLARQGLLGETLSDVADRLRAARYAAMEAGLNWDQIGELWRGEYMNLSDDFVPLQLILAGFWFGRSWVAASS